MEKLLKGTRKESNILRYHINLSDCLNF